MAILTNTFENELALLLFNNTDIANLGDTAGVQGSAAAGSYHLELCTAVGDAEAGTGIVVADYTGYAGRVAVARSSAGWTVSGSTASNAAAVEWPEKTGGADDTITHVAIYDLATGGTPLYIITLTSSRLVSDGDTPRFAAGTLTVTFN